MSDNKPSPIFIFQNRPTFCFRFSTNFIRHKSLLFYLLSAGPTIKSIKRFQPRCVSFRKDPSHPSFSPLFQPGGTFPCLARPCGVLPCFSNPGGAAVGRTTLCVFLIFPS